MEKYLMVYEDLWGNKESYKTNNLGEAIKQVVDNYDLHLGNNITIEDVYKDLDKYQEQEEKLRKAYKTNKLGNTLLYILDKYNLQLGEDSDLDEIVERLNSDYPYEAGTVGPGFYDMEVYDKEVEEGREPDYNGKIMIFYIGDNLSDELDKELTDFRDTLVKCEQLAYKFPIFKDVIYKKKLTGEGITTLFGNYYKSLHLSWGINRIQYDGDKRKVTNYRGNKDQNRPLFVMYFNSLNIYNSHENYGLEKIKDKVNVFHYDEINTTYYVEDEYIEEFLEAAVKWHEDAVKQNEIDKKRDRKTKLEKELADLNKE